MFPYSHIPKGHFLESRLGLRVFKHAFTVGLAPNQNEFRLEESSLLEGEFVVGLWVVPPTQGGQVSRSANVGQAVSQAVFNSCYLTLQEGQTKVVERIWLPHIALANEQGMPYLVNVAQIKMSESRLICFNAGSISANDYIAFNMDFLKCQK